MTDREFLILRTLLRTLDESGDYLCLPAHLRNEVGMAVPRMTQSEFDKTLSTADRQGLLTSVQGVRGPRYRCSPNGSAWLIENAD